MKWLDPDQPFSVRQSRNQIQGLLRLLGRPPRRVLDLGCGAGRVLVPLARAGHQLTGMDEDADALIRCRAALRRSRTTSELLHSDIQSLARLTHRFDAVLCLGNTFMAIAGIDDAVRLLKSIRDRLAPAGLFFIDDLPRLHLPERTSGRWRDGFSPDGKMQMVWHATDAVFTIRTERQVNPRRWTLAPGDVRFRLWCDRSLTLVAQRSGLSGPIRHKSVNLLSMTRAAGVNRFSGTTSRWRSDA